MKEKEKLKQKSYTASFDTFVLQPILQENRMSTRVIERNQLLVIPNKASHIISKTCTYYGKSLKTATNSSKFVLHKSHKLPIVVAHDYGIPLIFLPTMSYTSEQNVWIAWHAIENLQGDDMGCTIYLANNYSIRVNVSEQTLYRQYTLGSILERNFRKKQRQLSGSPNFD